MNSRSSKNLSELLLSLLGCFQGDGVQHPAEGKGWLLCIVGSLFTELGLETHFFTIHLQFPDQVMLEFTKELWALHVPWI